MWEKGDEGGGRQNRGGWMQHFVNCYTHCRQKKNIFIPIGELPPPPKKNNLDTIYPNQHPLKLFALNQL